MYRVDPTAASPDTGDYAGRDNSGKVEASLHGAMKGPSDQSPPDTVEIAPLPEVLNVNVEEQYVRHCSNAGWCLRAVSRTADRVRLWHRYRFMLSRLDQRAAALERRIVMLEDSIVAVHKLPPPTPVGVASQVRDAAA